jgi:gas vesicle protein
MNAYKIIIGVAAGVAAGAVLGILFAPAKGTDTRKKISKTGKDLTDSVKVKYHDILESVTEPFMASKRKVSENSRPGAVTSEMVY